MVDFKSYGLDELTPVLNTLVEKLRRSYSDGPALINFESFVEHYIECSTSFDSSCFNQASSQMTLILSKADDGELIGCSISVCLDALDALRFALEGDVAKTRKAIQSAKEHSSNLK